MLIKIGITIMLIAIIISVIPITIAVADHLFWEWTGGFDDILEKITGISIIISVAFFVLGFIVAGIGVIIKMWS